jgi:uncharacterized glyoxalase superfamily protein PhnB
MPNESALVPCLCYPDVAVALKWLGSAFGFEVRSLCTDGDGVTRAEAERDGLVIALESGGDAADPGAQAAGPARLRVTLADVGTVYRQAVSAGARIVVPLERGATGSCAFTVADVGGHVWTFAQGGGPAPAGPDAEAARRLGALTNLATPFAVRVAASVGVAQLIDSGTSELGALASASGTDRGALGRLLRYLAHRGLFTEPEPDVFALTETGRLLASRDPAGPAVWLDMAGPAARSDLAYPGLLHSVRTGEPGYAAVHGRDYWADLDADPVCREFFDMVMAREHERYGPQVAALYDWGPVTSVVDVGGGSGGLLAHLLHAHPQLRGTLVDRPGPARVTARRFSGSDLADRVNVVAGDFFGELPAAGDVYMVSRAISDWNDEAARAILRRCATAAGPGGRVLIVEVLPAEPFVPHRSPFDLQMLLLVGGQERSPAGFGALAHDAGLAVTQILRGTDGLVLIDCAPDSAHQDA